MTQEETTAVAKATPQAPVKWEESGLDLQTVGMARALFASGLFKNVANVAQAIVKVEMGKQLGVTAIEALSYIHIWEAKGRTSIQLGYPLVAALVLRSGRYRYEVVQNDDVACVLDFYRIRRDGSEYKLGTSMFTMEKAKANGLTTNAVWKDYGDVMLFARAITQGARRFCPDVLGGAGVATGEEPYIEGRARPAPDVTDVIAVDGEVVHVTGVLNDEAPVGQEPEPIVIEEPPEGFADPWSRFWARVKEWGYDKAWVHDYVGVPQRDGELAGAVRAKANKEGKTVAQVVAELLARIEVEHLKPPKPPAGRLAVASDIEGIEAIEEARQTGQITREQADAAAEVTYVPAPEAESETPAEYNARVEAIAAAAVAKRRGDPRDGAPKARQSPLVKAAQEAAARHVEVIAGQEVEVSEDELRSAYGVDEP